MIVECGNHWHFTCYCHMGLKLNSMATESVSIIIGKLIVQKRGNAAIQTHKQQGRRPCNVSAPQCNVKETETEGPHGEKNAVRISRGNCKYY